MAACHTVAICTQCPKKKRVSAQQVICTINGRPVAENAVAGTCPDADLGPQHRGRYPLIIIDAPAPEARPLTPAEKAAMDADAARRLAERDALTNALWLELHRRDWTAFSEEESQSWFAGWRHRVPNYGCQCRDELDALLKAHAMPFDRPADCFAAGVELHNATTLLVNVQRGQDKPTFAIEQAKELHLRKRNVQG